MRINGPSTYPVVAQGTRSAQTSSSWRGSPAGQVVHDNDSADAQTLSYEIIVSGASASAPSYASTGAEVMRGLSSTSAQALASYGMTAAMGSDRESTRLYRLDLYA